MIGIQSSTKQAISESMVRAENQRGFLMKKAVYMEDMTYRMIEHIAKKNSKTVLDFLTFFALQEYQEIEKKPHHRILKR